MSALPAPDSARAWILAARPATLTAAFVPVAVGTACAYAAGGFRALPALVALLGAVLIQIGTNFANDVFDFEKGADDGERLGPTRVVQAGLIAPGRVRRAMTLTFGLAALSGLYLVWVGGWPILAIGVLSILSGVAYTGGPFPLAYHGLGDLFVLVFFGFVAVCGTAFVQTGEVDTLALWASVPVGALATAILVVNNLRDRVTDVRAGKRTLAVRLGRRAAIAQYALLLTVAFAAPVWMWSRELGSAALLLPLLTAPIASYLLREVASREGKALNPMLGATAKLLLAHGALLALGIALGA